MGTPTWGSHAKMGQGRSCSCAAHTTQGTISLNDMLHQCDTGDIILFNNPMAATYFIKYATDSQWDHVGMILKYSKNPLETIMIESAGCGVFICYAEQRLKQVLDDKDPSIIGWRKLDGQKDRETWKKGVHAYAESLIDTPYEQNFSDFVKAWLGDDEWSKALLSYAGGTLGEGATKGEDLNSLFCSELCAAIYKYAGLMEGGGRDSNSYSPKDFSSQSNAHLRTQHPWSLLREKQVLTKIESSEELMGTHTAAGLGASPTGTGITIGDLLSKSSTKESNSMGLQRMAAAHALEVAKTDLAAAQASQDADAIAKAEAVVTEAQAAYDALAASAPAAAAPPPDATQASPAEAAAPDATAVTKVDPAQGDAQRDKQGGGCCR